jgi:hypothetical protein
VDRARIVDWLQRYGLAECAGVTCALIGSWVVHRLTGSAIAAGYGGAWGEAIGYSTVIVSRDFLAASRSVRARGRGFRVADGGRVIVGLVQEFGPSAILDTLFTRPFAMAAGIRWLGTQWGVLAGKVAADILFYSPVIFLYERRKRVERR